MTIIDPHLDIDQVSAAVDGDGDPGVAAHLLACLACREQVDAWRRVLVSLREVPALEPTALDRVIERALDECSGARAATSGAAATTAGMSTAGTPIAGPPTSGTPTSGRPGAGRPGAAPRRRRRPSLSSLPALPSVAAGLLVAALVTVAIVAIGHGGSSGSTSSASRSAASIGAGSPTAGSPRQLQSRRVSSSVSPSTTATAASPDLGTSAAHNGPSPLSTAVSGRAASGATQTTAELTAQLRRVEPAFATGTVPAATPCLRQVRALVTGLPDVTGDSPRYSESVILAAGPGRAFVFTGAHGFVAVVVHSGTCSVLATLVF